MIIEMLLWKHAPQETFKIFAKILQFRDISIQPHKFAYYGTLKVIGIALQHV